MTLFTKLDDSASFKLVLKPVEYETLMELMCVIYSFEEHLHIKDKVILCLMQSLYVRLDKKATFRKNIYKLSLPVAEAVAFQAFWTGRPMRQILTSGIINRIIGEIDQKITQKIQITTTYAY